MLLGDIIKYVRVQHSYCGYALVLYKHTIGLLYESINKEYCGQFPFSIFLGGLTDLELE